MCSGLVPAQYVFDDNNKAARYLMISKYADNELSQWLTINEMPKWYSHQYYKICQLMIQHISAPLSNTFIIFY